MYNEDDFLQLSGIQHFAFCRRQWALIHIEEQWEENFRTADGRIMHENAHNAEFREKRGDVITVRGMKIMSREYGISGECDVVEFTRDETNGVYIPKLKGKFRAAPVEYKRGKSKLDDCDRVQLCAQVLCLEEMLCCEINEGFIFYGEPHRRERIIVDDNLRNTTTKMLMEMHVLYERGYTPKVKRTKSCNACSLKNICLPSLEKVQSASEYLKSALEDGT